MEKITADCRVGILYIVMGFLLVWSIGFAGGGIYSLATGNQHATINDRLATPQEAMTMSAIGTVIGLAVLIGAICLLMYILNRRVMLEGNEIAAFNWKGVLEVKTNLDQILSIKEDGSLEGVKKFLVKTSQGDFKFDSSMRNYFALKKAMEESQGAQFEAPKAVPVFSGGVLPLSPFIPKERTFRYTFGYMHLFSFVWVGAIFWMAHGILTTPTSPGSSPPAVMLVGLLFFLAPGIWMQMTGWIEQIRLGPDGIQWIDWKGKTRAKATLDQIREIIMNRGETSSIQIETDNGSVKASSYLWGFGNLRTDVEKVIESRREANS